MNAHERIQEAMRRYGQEPPTNGDFYEPALTKVANFIDKLIAVAEAAKALIAAHQDPSKPGQACIDLQDTLADLEEE